REIPTLLLWRSEDRVISARDATDFRIGIPEVEVHIARGIGHMLPTDAPQWPYRHIALSDALPVRPALPTTAASPDRRLPPRRCSNSDAVAEPRARRSFASPAQVRARRPIRSSALLRSGLLPGRAGRRAGRGGPTLPRDPARRADVLCDLGPSPHLALGDVH